MSQTLRPHYLSFVGNGSDKFYIVCPLPDGKNCAIGYGPRTPTAGGAWTVKPISYGQSKLNEKLKKGYANCHHSEIQTSALNEMLSAIAAATRGPEPIIQKDGSLAFGPSSPAPAPSAAPKRPRGKDRINVWI